MSTPAGPYSIGSGHWPGLAKLIDLTAAIVFFAAANHLDLDGMDARTEAKMHRYVQWHEEQMEDDR